MRDWAEFERQHFLQTGHRRLGVTVVRGQGTRVWDDAGREYLDFTAGWGVASLGHCHPAVVEALCDQAHLLVASADDVYTVPQLELAELLLQHSPFDRVWLQNSGTEAVEVAIKLARKYGKQHLGGAYQIICAEDGFHGRTLGSLAAAGNRRYKAPFEPLPEGFIHVPFNDFHALRKATTHAACAVLLEPVQGEGGVNPADESYLRDVSAWCEERGILLILDEVQTGMGRTGKLFAFQHYGIGPDLVTLGKGLGGGAPISAVLLKEKAAVFGPSEHGTTFGGNPLVSAASLATVRWMIEHDIPGHAEHMGLYFMNRLQQLEEAYPVVSEVRGRGLLIAMSFLRDVAMDITHACTANGLLINPLRANTVRFLPPLTVTPDEIERAIAILDRSMEQVLGTREAPSGVVPPEASVA